MSKPTTAEIRERHESSVEQDASLVPKGTDEWVLELLASFNYCRIDRGILLDRLETENKALRGYVQHKPTCDRGRRTAAYMISPCTCGLDGLKQARENDS